MKVEVLILLWCLSASFAAEIVDVNAVENDDSLKPQNRRARLIGLGEFGGLGIVGGIGIVGGGVKGFGGPGSKKKYWISKEVQKMVFVD